MSKKCVCGAENDDSAKFCRNCGKYLSVTTVNNENSSTKSERTSNSSYTTSGTSKSSGTDVFDVLRYILGIGAIITAFILFFNQSVNKTWAMVICAAGLSILGVFNR